MDQYSASEGMTYIQYLPNMSSSFSDMKTWTFLLFTVLYINMISISNVPSYFGSWIFRTALFVIVFTLFCYDMTIGSLFAAAATISLVYSEIQKSRLVESYGGKTYRHDTEKIEDEDGDAETFADYNPPLEEENNFSPSSSIFDPPILNSDNVLKTASNDFLANNKS